MKIGIIGLPSSGRSSLLKVLGEDGIYPLKVKGAKYKGSCAMVALPDDRVGKLAEMYSPKKTTPVKVEFVDIEGAAGSFDRSFFDFVRDCDALLHLVRAFKSEAVLHSAGSIDPERDCSDIEEELVMADLDILERRLDKAEREAAGGKDHAKRELPALKKTVEILREGKFVSEMNDTNALELLSNYGLLTAKPLLTVFNIGEEDLENVDGSDDRLRICVELEKELVDIPVEEREQIAQEMGIKSPARDRVIHKAFETMGLITFFTAGVPEVRAWPVPIGTPAKKAAGKIHSDLERGFIRAEILTTEQLLEAGSLEEARKQKLVRSEGADCEIKDGDVVLIRFNV